MTFAQRMMEARDRLHPNQTINALSVENDKLRTAMWVVVDAFEAAEAKGPHSMDRQFAIDILRLVLPPPLPRS